MSIETFLKDFSHVALENFGNENRQIKNTKWSFLNSRSINIPIYESKHENDHSNSHLTSQINISLCFDTLIGTCSFREGWVGLSFKVYDIRISVTIGQSSLRTRWAKFFSWILETNIPPQVKSYWLTLWLKKKTGWNGEFWFSLSRHKMTKSTS